MKGGIPLKLVWGPAGPILHITDHPGGTRQYCGVAPGPNEVHVEGGMPIAADTSDVARGCVRVRKTLWLPICPECIDKAVADVPPPPGCMPPSDVARALIEGKDTARAIKQIINMDMMAASRAAAAAESDPVRAGKDTGGRAAPSRLHTPRTQLTLSGPGVPCMPPPMLHGRYVLPAPPKNDDPAEWEKWYAIAGPHINWLFEQSLKGNGKASVHLN